MLLGLFGIEEQIDGSLDFDSVKQAISSGSCNHSDGVAEFVLCLPERRAYPKPFPGWIEPHCLSRHTHARSVSSHSTLTVAPKQILTPPCPPSGSASLDGLGAIVQNAAPADQFSLIPLPEDQGRGVFAAARGTLSRGQRAS